MTCYIGLLTNCVLCDLSLLLLRSQTEDDLNTKEHLCVCVFVCVCMCVYVCVCACVCSVCVCVMCV